LIWIHRSRTTQYPIGQRPIQEPLCALNNECQAGWYYHQIERLGAGLAPEPGLSPWRALLAHFGHDFARAMARKRARTDQRPPAI